MAEYKSAQEYIQSKESHDFHKKNKETKKKNIAKKMGPDMSDPKVKRHAKKYDDLVFGKGEKGKSNKHWFNTGEHK